MALVLTRYGRYKTSSEADYGVQAAGQMRACVFDAASDNIWVTKIGGWVGKSGGTNATVRWALYETDGSKNPTDRLGYSEAATVSTSMAGPGGGASYSPDVDGDPLMIRSGRRYAIAQLPTGAGIGHSMREAAAISADNEQFYDRSGLSQPPPATFGSYSSSVEGHLTAWAEGYVNEAPRRPGNFAPTGTINETAPTFEADFRDNNGAWGAISGDGVDTGDKMSRYHIQLRQVGSTTLLWNTTYTASSAERAANRISRAYGGSSLSRGTQYEYRIRTADEFGAWYAWTDNDWVQFTVANLGFVTLDDVPTGKIESNTPDFKGRWTHQSSASTNAVQVRLLSASGTVLKTSGVISKTVTSSTAPGTLFTIDWADTGFTPLAWGTNYRYQIRARDTLNNWSDWSASRSFSTNAAPSIPANLSPANGAIYSDFPLLSFAMSDADDTTGTGLTATIRITQPDTGTVDVTPTLNTTTGKWEYQTTSSELDEYGAYAWAAIGFDGTLYSGEATDISDGTWSASNTFVYANGPTVTIDAPESNDTLTTATFDVEWTTTDQVKYKVAVYRAGTTEAVYESNDGEWTVSSDGSHTVPSGYVRNGETYDITVTVEDSTPLQGSATVTDILIDYTPPDPVANFQATAIAVGTDPVPSAIRLSWDQTAYAAPEFREYTIYRRASGGVDQGELILARITDPSEVALIDYAPASGYEYTYGIRVVTLTGLDELESDVVEATATVNLETTVLTLAGNGGTYRTNLTNVRERSDDRTIDEAVYQPLSRSEPTTVRARTRYYTASLEAAIIDTDEATAAQHKAEFEALDAQHGTVCMRYADGTKRFVKIANLSIRWEPGGFFTASFTARQEFWREGVS